MFRKIRFLKVGPVLVALCLALSPAWAETASRLPRASITIDLAILTGTSRLAANHTDNPALLSYAAEEPTVQGGFFPPEADPHVKSTDMAGADREALQTGRSAAVAGTTSSTSVAPRDIAIATAGLATLNSLHGAAFDRLYVGMQRSALLSLRDNYLRYEARDHGDLNAAESGPLQKVLSRIGVLETF